MEWQPIETAPNGKEILVFMEGEIFQGNFEGTYWEFATADFHGCGCCSGTRDYPTHWMPLPEPPKGQE